MPIVPDSSVKELTEIVPEQQSTYDITDPDHIDWNVPKNSCVYRIYLKQLLTALYTQVWLWGQLL